MNPQSGLSTMAILSGVALTTLLASGDPVAASTVAVQPHRALYSVSLESAGASSDVIGVSGRMAFEWRDDCDGWAVEQRYIMDFARADGEGFALQSQYTTWESKSGDFYRFVVERVRGDEVDRVEGRATIPLPLGSEPGTATFSSPEEIELDLASDTLFPSLHTARLLEAAVAGDRFLRATVFDGSEVELPYLISGVIGDKRDDPAPVDAALAQGAYWPVRLAWFPSDGGGAEPDFEMTVELLNNGIARGLTVDYGDFSVRMELEKLEGLSAPERC